MVVLETRSLSLCCVCDKSSFSLFRVISLSFSLFSLSSLCINMLVCKKHHLPTCPLTNIFSFTLHFHMLLCCTYASSFTCSCPSYRTPKFGRTGVGLGLDLHFDMHTGHALLSRKVLFSSIPVLHHHHPHLPTFPQIGGWWGGGNPTMPAAPPTCPLAPAKSFIPHLPSIDMCLLIGEPSLLP